MAPSEHNEPLSTKQQEEIMERLTSISPNTTARTAGFFYLVTIVCRMLAESMVRHRIVVSTDAVATAENILANRQLFIAGFVADIASFASYVILTALLHDLFKRVNPRLSLIAAFLSLICCAAQAFSSVFQLVALFLLGGSDYLKVFTPEQLQALALIAMKIRAVAYHNVGL